MLFVTSHASARDGEVRPLSLAEAVQIARENSYQVRMARSRVKQASGQNLESLSGFFPRLSISENYVKSNDPVNVFGLKLKQGVFSQQDFSLSLLNNPDSFENFTTAFHIQQPIFNLDAFWGKAAADLGVKASKASAERIEETVLLNVKKAYFGLILAADNERAMAQAVASASAHRDNAKVAFEQGLINRADYLGAEVRVAELQEQLITARHQIANASDMLKFMMGLPEDVLIVPTDSLQMPVARAHAAAAPGLSLERSDLQAMRFQLKAASRNHWMQRSTWVPRLNAFGTFEWNASEAFHKDATSWIIGVQLRWDLFGGFGKFGRSKQAAAKKEQAAVQYQRAEEHARLEVRKAERALKAATERIEVAQAAVAQASESLRIVEERFNQGLEKAADLLDKEVALTNSKLRLLKAKHDFNVARSDLDYAVGRTE